MAITRSESGSVLHRLLRQPDEAMLETRAGGELVVARMRVWASLLLLLMPLANHLSGGTLAETLIGLTGAASATAMSSAPEIHPSPGTMARRSTSPRRSSARASQSSPSPRRPRCRAMRPRRCMAAQLMPAV